MRGLGRAVASPGEVARGILIRTEEGPQVSGHAISILTVEKRACIPILGMPHERHRTIKLPLVQWHQGKLERLCCSYLRVRLVRDRAGNGHGTRTVKRAHDGGVVAVDAHQRTVARVGDGVLLAVHAQRAGGRKLQVPGNRRGIDRLASREGGHLLVRKAVLDLCRKLCLRCGNGLGVCLDGNREVFGHRDLGHPVAREGYGCRERHRRVRRAARGRCRERAVPALTGYRHGTVVSTPPGIGAAKAYGEGEGLRHGLRGVALGKAQGNCVGLLLKDRPSRVLVPWHPEGAVGAERRGLVTAGERELDRAHRLERGHVPAGDLVGVAREVRDGAVVCASCGYAHGGVGVRVLERDAGHAHGEPRGVNALLSQLGEKHVVHVGVGAVRERGAPVLVLEARDGTGKRVRSDDGLVKPRRDGCHATCRRDLEILARSACRNLQACRRAAVKRLPLCRRGIGACRDVPLQADAILVGDVRIAAGELRGVGRGSRGVSGEKRARGGRQNNMVEVVCARCLDQGLLALGRRHERAAAGPHVLALERRGELECGAGDAVCCRELARVGALRVIRRIPGARELGVRGEVRLVRTPAADLLVLRLRRKRCPCLRVCGRGGELHAGDVIGARKRDGANRILRGGPVIGGRARGDNGVAARRLDAQVRANERGSVRSLLGNGQGCGSRSGDV